MRPRRTAGHWCRIRYLFERTFPRARVGRRIFRFGRAGSRPERTTRAFPASPSSLEAVTPGPVPGTTGLRVVRSATLAAGHYPFVPLSHIQLSGKSIGILINFRCWAFMKLHQEGVPWRPLRFRGPKSPAEVFCWKSAVRRSFHAGGFHRAAAVDRADRGRVRGERDSA